VGMKAIYFNPNQKSNNSNAWNEVSNLGEIKKVLL